MNTVDNVIIILIKRTKQNEINEHVQPTVQREVAPLARPGVESWTLRMTGHGNIVLVVALNLVSNSWSR